MKILVTGAKGQLGADVVTELAGRGHTVIACGREEMDITDQSAVERVIGAHAPDAVIHCAAWTAVDAAEEEQNIPLVRSINVDGTKYIAEVCKRLGCPVMYISTDYVFDGNGTEPWKSESTEFMPRDVYGKSKLDGEYAVTATADKFFIVRIAWAFGLNGKNFVKTMLKLGETHDFVRVVDDQIGTPTYTPDLARLLADMIVTDKYGIYHATNEGGYISWADFAEAIFAEAGMKTSVIRVTTEEYGSKARRPFNSRLDRSKLVKCGFEPLPDWQDALKRYIKQCRTSNA